MTQDPVCDRDVDERRAKASGRVFLFDGQLYYFCSEECLHEFESCPDFHIHPRPEAETQEAEAG